MAVGALIIGDEILSGKRQDKHFAHLTAALPSRGVKLAWARYEPDDRVRLTTVLRESFAGGEIVLAFGGVGATPDDHTRQAAAAALELPLVLHPEALATIVARFGEAAYPHRVHMAEFPQGSAIIPNPVNGIASFAISNHFFFPGFPEMAWPMLEWVLDRNGEAWRTAPEAERSILVFGAGEGQLVALMDENVARFPALKLFSLPAFQPEGARRLELGVRGDPALVDAAIAHLRAGVLAGGFHCEDVPGQSERAP